MTRDDLITLLERIVDGDVTPSDVERARVLAQHDDRLPTDLRTLVLMDDEDLVDDAAALLAILGVDPSEGLLSDAVRHESGIDIADAVLAAIGSPEKAPVAEAVRSEAGPVPEMEAPEDGWQPIAAALVERLTDEARGGDVSRNVLAAVGAPIPHAVADAVRAEAGRVDIAHAVMADLGVTPLAIAAAVRDEAGTVDVVPAVMGTVEATWLCGLLDGQLLPQAHQDAARALMKDPARGRELTALASVGPALREAIAAEAGSVSLWAPVATSIGLADPEHVEGWDGASFASELREEAGDVDIAEAVMRRIHGAHIVSGPVAEPVVPEPANTGWRAVGPAAALVAVAALLLLVVGVPTGRVAPSQGEPLQFASASEVTIEELSYADDVIVHVMPAEGGAPLIVWVDEEVNL